jgi:hypothetical protein
VYIGGFDKARKNDIVILAIKKGSLVAHFKMKGGDKNG